MLLPNRGKLNECEMLHSQEDCFSGVPCLLLLVALSIFSCKDRLCTGDRGEGTIWAESDLVKFVSVFSITAAVGNV